MAAAPFGPGEREGAEERGDAAGEEEERGDTRPRRGVAREVGGKQRSEGEGGPESEGEVRGGRGECVASPGRRGRARQAGREEVAGARGRARQARARPPGREEDDRGGRRLVGWAAPVGCQHGSWAGKWAPGKWLGFSLFFLYFCSVFYLIATEFKFKLILKQCQNSPG